MRFALFLFLCFQVFCIAPTKLNAQTKKELKILNKAKASIIQEYDKYEQEYTWRTPIFGEKSYSLLTEPVQFMKISSAPNSSGGDLYMILYAYGNTISYDEEGVILLFEDGTRFNKPNVKISVDSNTYGWTYSAFIPITVSELELFASKKVEGFKLGIFERDMSYRKNQELITMGFTQRFLELMQ